MLIVLSGLVEGKPDVADLGHHLLRDFVFFFPITFLSREGPT
jgi:hypothetical protein